MFFSEGWKMEIMSLKNLTGGENDTLALFIPLSTQVLCVYEPSSLNTHTPRV